MSEKKRCRGIAVHRSLLIGTTSTPLTQAEMLSSPPEHTHKWTVAVRSAASNPLPPLNQKELALVGSDSSNGGDGFDGSTEQSRGISTRNRDTETDYHRLVGGKDDISHFIKRVQFRLHETYPSPTRNLDKPPYQVTETGWGEFEIQIKIFFVNEANEKPLTYFHHLKLHPWQPIPGSSLAYPNPLPAQPASNQQKEKDSNNQPEKEKNTDGMDVDGPNDASKRNQDAVQEGNPMDVDSTDASKREKSAEAGALQNQIADASSDQNDSSQNKTADLGSSSSDNPNSNSDSNPTSSQPKLPVPPVVHSWQYEEIVFPEPTEAFFDILNSNVPTPLPETSAEAFTDPSTYHQFVKLRDELAAKNYQSTLPASTASDANSTSRTTRTALTNKKQLLTPPHPIHSPSGYLTEAISMETINNEGDRLERARIESVRQLEKGRERLIAMERKLKELRSKSQALVGNEPSE